LELEIHDNFGSTPSMNLMEQATPSHALLQCYLVPYQGGKNHHFSETIRYPGTGTSIYVLYWYLVPGIVELTYQSVCSSGRYCQPLYLVTVWNTKHKCFTTKRQTWLR